MSNDESLENYRRGLENFIHGSHVKMEGENQLHQVAVWLPQTQLGMFMPLP